MTYKPTPKEEALFQSANAELNKSFKRWRKKYPPAMLMGGLLCGSIDVYFDFAKANKIDSKVAMDDLLGHIGELIKRRAA